MLTSKIKTLSPIIFLSFNTLSNSLVDDVADANMPAFAWHEEEWEEKNYATFLKESVKRRQHPKARKKRQNGFEFFKKTENPNSQIPHSVFNGSTTWNDLNLFCGYSDKQVYLGKSVDKTFLELGTVSLLLTLATPTANIKQLKIRQNIVKFFLEHEELITELKNIFSKISTSENVMLSFWRVDNFKHVSKKLYFRTTGFKWLNNYRHLLFLNSLFGHSQRTGIILSCITVAATLLVYSAFKAINIPPSETFEKQAISYQKSSVRTALTLLKTKVLHPIKTFFSNILKNRAIAATTAAGIGVVSALGIPESTSKTYQFFVIEDCVQKLMIEVARFVESMRKTYEMIKTEKIIAQYEECSALIDFFEKKVPASKKLQQLLNILKKNTFSEKSFILSHKGNVLCAFRLMHQLKKEFEPALIAMGNIDKWSAIARLYKEAQNTNCPFCFAQYESLEKKTDMYEKTTNIILAQTFGITPVHSI